MSGSRPRMVIIDGHALIYVQFFALPADKFKTSSGEPTNATWGFARTILDLLESPAPPEYLAVAFDMGLSGRGEVFPEYKGHREDMPNEMVLQVPRIKELVTAFNIPILAKEGYEADDMIASVALQAVEHGVDVHIMTVDHDLLQLVNEHISVEIPGRFGRDASIYNSRESVIQKFGIPPELVPDYKALVGDSSDNIPGVEGIGKGTAPKLLLQYGSLEGLYTHLEEIKGKMRERLEAGRDSAFMSKHLATIIRDIPFDFDLSKCVAKEYDPAVVGKLFEALEFRSLTRRLKLPDTGTATAKRKAAASAAAGQMSMFPAEAVAEAPAEAPIRVVVNTVIVDTEEGLTALVNALAAATQIAFDTETTSTDPMKAKLVGISLAVDGETGYYLPVGHIGDAGEIPPVQPRQLPTERVIEAIRPAMTDPSKAKVAHNASYDLIMLRRYGLDVTPVGFDTMLAEFVLNPDGRSKGLKTMASMRLGVEMQHIDELIGKGKNQITMDRVQVDRAAPYAAADAAMTYRLVEPVRADIAKIDREANARLSSLMEELEIPLIPVVVDLDMAGAKMDLPYLADLSKQFGTRLNTIKTNIYQLAGEEFNIGSLKQLNDILFKKLNLPTAGLSKNSNGFSVDAEALEILRPHHEIAKWLLDWRELEKLRNTYVDALPAQVDAEGRVHTTYNQIGSNTGRISSENPNLQNIPVRTEEGRGVRKAFIAAPGYQLLSVDYSQIELRILAHFSKDAVLLDAFRHNQDIHSATAATIYSIPFEQVSKEQRYFAKRVNFGLMYGMGAYRLAQDSGLTFDDSKAFIKTYFERFPGVKAYLDGSKELAREQGYLETLLGRRRDFTGLRSASGSRAYAARLEREAINMPIQGTAADIMKIAMIRLSKRLKDERSRARMILQVHDELVLEVPEDDVPATAAIVREIMEGAYTLDAPLKAEANFGHNWTEMRPIS